MIFDVICLDLVIFCDPCKSEFGEFPGILVASCCPVPNHPKTKQNGLRYYSKNRSQNNRFSLHSNFNCLDISMWFSILPLGLVSTIAWAQHQVSQSQRRNNLLENWFIVGPDHNHLYNQCSTITWQVGSLVSLHSSWHWTWHFPRDLRSLHHFHR